LLLQSPARFLRSRPGEKQISEDTVRKCLCLIRDFHYYYSVFTPEDGLHGQHFNIHSQKVGINSLQSVLNWDKLPKGGRINKFKLCSYINNMYLAF
jgi:hypothetical protein